MYGCCVIKILKLSLVNSKVFGRQLIQHVSQYYRANQLFERNHLNVFSDICLYDMGIYQTFVI